MEIDPTILRRITVLLAAKVMVVLEPEGAPCDGVVVVTVALRRDAGEATA